MSFFENSKDGFPNFFKYFIRDDYKEPEVSKDIIEIFKQGDIPFHQLLRQIDYDDPNWIDGYPYKSKKRLDRFRKRAAYKPVGPYDMFKYPITSSMVVGWWMFDPELKNEDWYKIRKF